MPFKSKSQMRACFAANDPNWDCHKWAKETGNTKKLPERMKKATGGMYRPKKSCMECGGTPTYHMMQDGGHFDPRTGQWVQDQNPQFTGTGQSYDWMQTNGVNPQRPNVSDPIATMDISQNQGTPNDFKVITPEEKKKHWNPAYALRGATTAASLIGGMLERKRQNQYMYDQMSTLGQLDALPVENFQPNPYSMYAMRGGKIVRYQRGGDFDTNAAIRKMDPRMMQMIAQANQPNSQVRMPGDSLANRQLPNAVLQAMQKEALDANGFLGGWKVNPKKLGNLQVASNQYYTPTTQDIQRMNQELKNYPLGITHDFWGTLGATHYIKKKGGGINPAHRGWCTPMTKSTCTGKRRQFALNMKKMARENHGG